MKSLSKGEGGREGGSNLLFLDCLFDLSLQKQQKKDSEREKQNSKNELQFKFPLSAKWKIKLSEIEECDLLAAITFLLSEKMADENNQRKMMVLSKFK